MAVASPPPSSYMPSSSFYHISDNLAPPHPHSSSLPSPYPQHVDPSPTESNGTENTDIEEEVQQQQDQDQQEREQEQDEDEEVTPKPPSSSTLPQQQQQHKSKEQVQSRQKLDKLDMMKVVQQASSSSSSSRRPISDNDDDNEAPSSVIHAPPGFKELQNSNNNNNDKRSGSGRSPHSDSTTTTTTNGNINTSSSTNNTRDSNFTHHDSSTSPSTPDAALGPHDQRLASSITSPLNTNVSLEKGGLDRPTPQAQTRQEAEEEEWKRRSRRTSSSLEGFSCNHKVNRKELTSTEDIPEAMVLYNSADETTKGRETHAPSFPGDEIAELQSALHECWTLCNTLSNLSSSHRQRIFTGSGPDNAQEHVWRCCWHLCKQLYESYKTTQTLPILEMCREFCQALFDVRLRGDETVDAVLRVSFEMNNHLYNTHDRNLPEAFRERTLDFYVTLCHRMMKQPTSLERETDVLLRACWSLAEALFNLRQVDRDARGLDELLASAMQACWDLSDIFREGWSHLRPTSRTTPRPSQTAFPSSVTRYPVNQSERAPSSLSSEYHDAPSLPPETPTTIFDDATTASSPESVDVPNILILGPAAPVSSGGSARGTRHHDRWSSNASTLSDYSESASSQRTSSTARASSNSKHLLRLRCLVVRAALNVGFSRTSGQSLSAFAKSLPVNTFGSQTWQIKLLGHYKRLVVVDKSLRSAATMPGRSLNAVEVAKAVTWLSRSEEWTWLTDLYRFVFGFGVETAEIAGGFFQI